MQELANMTFVWDPRKVISKNWVEVIEKVQKDQLRFSTGLLERPAELLSWHEIDPTDT